MYGTNHSLTGMLRPIQSIELGGDEYHGLILDNDSTNMCLGNLRLAAPRLVSIETKEYSINTL